MLRSNMFELADRLVGIYKTYNCTKSVTINPEAVGSPNSHPITNKVSIYIKFGLLVFLFLFNKRQND